MTMKAMEDGKMYNGDSASTETGSIIGMSPSSDNSSGLPFKTIVWFLRSPFLGVKWYSSLLSSTLLPVQENALWSVYDPGFLRNLNDNALPPPVVEEGIDVVIHRGAHGARRLARRSGTNESSVNELSKRLLAALAGYKAVVLHKDLLVPPRAGIRRRRARWRRSGRRHIADFLRGEIYITTPVFSLISALINTVNDAILCRILQQFLGFNFTIFDHPQLLSTSVPISSRVHRNPSRCISCCFDGPNRCPSLTGAKGNPHGGGERVGFRVGAKGKGKDNVWSIDNELAKEVSEKENRSRRKRRQGGRKAKKFNDSKVMVSAAMLIELENVLQTQEPVIRPSWNTFVSSVSGIWKGVGAVFSPITAEMEPIEVGSKNEHLFDCYTLSRVEEVPAREGGTSSRIHRKINWVTLNPHGELLQQDDKKKGEDSSFTIKGVTNGGKSKYVVPSFESFDFTRSDVMEEDFMDMEPGLVYFEDGSYSRGPVDIPVGNVDGSEYYLSPTYKFEQCLVKGCHKRLRIVHTIEFSNGGADIQILRVAVHEEQWDSPANIDDHSDIEFDVKPFSQRKRTRPSELTGSWKVFEVSATPIYGDDTLIDDGNSSPYVYFCMETVKKRSFPESRGYFGEEEMMDMQDVAVLWLPGGVTSYVDISKDGILCIGVGWYSDEGIHLVMERDYGTDGKLIEVRSKSEVKRRWPDQLLG